MAVGEGGGVLVVEVDDLGAVPVPVCVVTTGGVLSDRGLGLRAGNDGSFPAATGTVTSTRFNDSGRADDAVAVALRDGERASPVVSFASRTPVPNRTGTITNSSPSRMPESVHRVSPPVHWITDWHERGRQPDH